MADKYDPTLKRQSRQKNLNHKQLLVDLEDA